jgi:preprotein translocase subunit SecY
MPQTLIDVLANEMTGFMVPMLWGIAITGTAVLICIGIICRHLDRDIKTYRPSGSRKEHSA